MILKDLAFGGDDILRQFLILSRLSGKIFLACYGR